MQKFLFLPILFFAAAAASGQVNSGARLFLDIPTLYATAPSVENVGHQLGLGVGTAFNVGTHWSVARVGGGADFTLDPSSKELQETFLATPYLLAEVGAGIYRSNGNRCAKTKSNAFTAIGKVGVRYTFYPKKVRELSTDNGILDYSVGRNSGTFSSAICSATPKYS